MKEFINEYDLYDIFNINNQKFLDEILNEVYFYPFICKDFVASTNIDHGTIYLQGEINNVKSKEEFYILFTFQLICLLQEIFHYYFSTMKYISKGKENYNPPKPKNNSQYRKRESGQWFEEEFFGKHFRKLSFKESIFILKSYSYKNNIHEFKQEFLNISKVKFQKEEIKNYIDGIQIPESISNLDLDLDNTYYINVFKNDTNELTLTVGEDIFDCDLSDELINEKTFQLDFLNKSIERIQKEIFNKK